MRICLFVVLPVVIGLAGCRVYDSGHYSATVPVLDAESANAAGLSPQAVDEAAGLYVAKCVRCHKSYDPRRYGDAEWHSWMRKMSEKARLKPDQAQLLARYLEAIRVGAHAAGDTTER